MTSRLISWLLSPSGLTPHGFCLLWQPGLIWTHAVADFATGAAYFTIPIALAVITRQRKDLVFRPIPWLFISFILLCGITHWLDVLTLWVPTYGVQGAAKAITAGVSVITAIALCRVLPEVLSRPSVAEFKEVHEKLRHGSERIALAAESVRIGIWDLDIAHDTLIWDAWMYRLYGLEPQDGVGTYDLWARHLHPDDRASAEQALENCIKGLRPFRFEFRIVWDDGSIHSIGAAGQVTRDAAGHATRVIGTNWDITEASELVGKVTLQQELLAGTLNSMRESEARVCILAHSNITLETQIEERTHERDLAWRNSRDLQLVVDSQGVFQAANEAWTTLLGWRPDEIVGHSYLEFLHPEDHPVAEVAAGIADDGKLRPYEERYRHKDGTYHWISWVAALVNGVTYASGRHQTAEREAAAKLEATQEQLRQSQKMELLGQLTGGIAHDFNNLLGIVQLNLELIQERVSEDPEADGMAGMALKATGRGASLTHQLLAYARQQPLEPRTVNIETLLSGMAGLLARTLGESIEIKTIMPADLWTTSVDPHQLENALLNLGVNALHAMPDGGKLIIEASNKVLDEIYVELNPDVLPGHYVAVAVTDTGTGMSADILEKVLEPFFTTKPVGKGSGLGLSMVHGFAKQSGGHLKIYSEPGLGTTVNLYLPRAWIGAETEAAATRPEVPVSAGGELVLVVEDDPYLRGLTLKILGGLGYRTIEAEDGPAACAILDQGDPIDLLLTDIVLPKGMYGPELARLARLSLPDIKVLYMSGYPRDAVFRDRMLDTGTHLLSKPFSKATLAGIVRQVLDGRTET